MIPHSPLLHRTILLLSAGFFLSVPLFPGHAQEMTTPCQGLRAKELVLCWKKQDPQRARGDHDAFHRGQSAVHLKWHQEHRGRTEAQVTIDHQKLHKDTVQKHQEFHRSPNPPKSRDAKTAPIGGLSKKRQLQPRT